VQTRTFFIDSFDGMSDKDKTIAAAVWNIADKKLLYLSPLTTHHTFHHII
jgi:hypothetical protein